MTATITASIVAEPGPIPSRGNCRMSQNFQFYKPVSGTKTITVQVRNAWQVDGDSETNIDATLVVGLYQNNATLGFDKFITNLRDAATFPIKQVSSGNQYYIGLPQGTDLPMLAFNFVLLFSAS